MKNGINKQSTSSSPERTQNLRRGILNNDKKHNREELPSSRVPIERSSSTAGRGSLSPMVQFGSSVHKDRVEGSSLRLGDTKDILNYPGPSDFTRKRFLNKEKLNKNVENNLSITHNYLSEIFKKKFNDIQKENDFIDYKNTLNALREQINKTFQSMMKYSQSSNGSFSEETKINVEKSLSYMRTSLYKMGKKFSEFDSIDTDTIALSQQSVRDIKNIHSEILEGFDNQINNFSQYILSGKKEPLSGLQSKEEEKISIEQNITGSITGSKNVNNANPNMDTLSTVNVGASTSGTTPFDSAEPKIENPSVLESGSLTAKTTQESFKPEAKNLTEKAVKPEEKSRLDLTRNMENLFKKMKETKNSESEMGYGIQLPGEDGYAPGSIDSQDNIVNDMYEVMNNVIDELTHHLMNSKDNDDFLKNKSHVLLYQSYMIYFKEMKDVKVNSHDLREKFEYLDNKTQIVKNYYSNSVKKLFDKFHDIDRSLLGKSNLQIILPTQLKTKDLSSYEKTLTLVFEQANHNLNLLLDYKKNYSHLDGLLDKKNEIKLNNIEDQVNENMYHLERIHEKYKILTNYHPEQDSPFSKNSTHHSILEKFNLNISKYTEGIIELQEYHSFLKKMEHKSSSLNSATKEVLSIATILDEDFKKKLMNFSSSVDQLPEYLMDMQKKMIDLMAKFENKNNDVLQKIWIELDKEISKLAQSMLDSCERVISFEHSIYPQFSIKEKQNTTEHRYNIGVLKRAVAMAKKKRKKLSKHLAAMKEHPIYGRFVKKDSI